MRKAIIGATALIVLGVSTVAVAAVPDGNGVIHACRNTRDGGLRVIDTAAGQKCGRNEVPLDWNQAGPAGPPGPARSQLMLVDAAGGTVGPYLGGASAGIAEVFHEDRLWEISATDGRFRGAKTFQTMWWTSADCTGQPYIRMLGNGGNDGRDWWYSADIDYALTQATLAWGSEAYVPTWPATDLNPRSWRSGPTDICNVAVGSDFTGRYVPLTKVPLPPPVLAPVTLRMQ